jgi:hypothetical protein
VPVPPAKTGAPKAKQLPPAQATSSVTFVAALPQQKSRMDALMTFVDLQQMHGDLLSDNKVEVKETNFGGNGARYRAVISAPGSRDAASGVCNLLKSAGYNGCSVVSIP